MLYPILHINAKSLAPQATALGNTAIAERLRPTTMMKHPVFIIKTSWFAFAVQYYKGFEPLATWPVTSPKNLHPVVVCF
jgi:hypothetical protein